MTVHCEARHAKAQVSVEGEGLLLRCVALVSICECGRGGAKELVRVGEVYRAYIPNREVRPRGEKRPHATTRAEGVDAEAVP